MNIMHFNIANFITNHNFIALLVLLSLYKTFFHYFNRLENFKYLLNKNLF